MMTPALLCLLFENMYILGGFTEKLYSKPLERNVVYIPNEENHRVTQRL